MDKVRVLIDTDLGDDVDDAAAFMLALSWGAIEIAGVTTVFKDTKRAGMVNDRWRFYGRDDIPVCAGYGNPIVGTAGLGLKSQSNHGLLKGRWSRKSTQWYMRKILSPQKVKKTGIDHPGYGSHDQPGHGILKGTSADA